MIMPNRDARLKWQGDAKPSVALSFADGFPDKFPQEPPLDACGFAFQSMKGSLWPGSESLVRDRLDIPGLPLASLG
jgi:hypothetical protein